MLWQNFGKKYIRLKFFTNILICTNILGEIKQTSNDEVKEGTIIISRIRNTNKQTTPQVKTIIAQANMFDMVILI